MPNHDAAKAAREREVFKLFARLTKLPVKPDTIEQKLDAPDISCTLQNGETVTYELVTLDSERSSQTWGDFYSMSGAWGSTIKSLSEDRRQLFLDRYRHASITPEYSARPSRKERGERIALIIDKLLEQPAGFVGLVDCGQDKVRVEKKLGRSEAHGSGPILLDGMSPIPQPVAWHRIREKVEKRYKIAGRFELIAYSYRDTLLHQSPEDAAPPVDDIRDWLRDSAFSRVWIVEWRYKTIYRHFDRPS
jgi:hypothetical protein